MKYKNRIGILFSVILTLFAASCSLYPQIHESQAQLTPEQLAISTAPAIPLSTNTLRGAAENGPRKNLAIGTAVDIDAFNTDAKYRSLLGQQFNMLVPENVMKMYVTHPNIDTFDYSQGDQLVAFAKAHNMQVGGGALLWTSEVPTWIIQGGYTKSELLGILRDYITNVVGHYKGQVQSWEVVNEPLDTNEHNQPSIWDQVIGPEYIDDAFRWAHKADPQAKLYINDFGVEGSDTKAEQYYDLVQGLVTRGVPIDGVGFEEHLDIALPYSQNQATADMERLAQLGLQVQTTEVDIKIQNSTASLQDNLNQQAQLYASVVHACQAVTACNAVVIWGFTDRYSWIPAFTGHPDQPLIYDDEYRPKPAYNAVKNALLHGA